MAESLANDYDSDTVLSQALDMLENSYDDDCDIFITQNTFSNIPDDDKDDIFDLLKNSIDITDFAMPNGPQMMGSNKWKRAGNVTVSATDVQENEGTTFQEENKPTTSGEKRRFTPVSDDMHREKSRQFCPPNTLRKNKWAVNTFYKWRAEMIDSGTEKHGVPGLLNILEHQQDISHIANADLDLVLSVFVMSLKKQDGGEYTGDSLFAIMCALQRHLEYNGRRVSFFNDEDFCRTKNALDNCMQDRCKKGIGLQRRQSEIITLEQENKLWEEGFLGDKSPDVLLKTVFWVVGIHFGLRGGSEHRNLTRANFKIVTDPEGARYLQYTESVSKTYRGGLKHRRIEPHSAKAYENLQNPSRCPVHIFEKYMSKLHPNADNEVFYFKPVSVLKGNDIWYTLVPIGHNMLRDMVKTIMSKGGFTGHYTNHSLRATTASRLWHGKVSEQLIRQQTGHRSNAIFSYKRPSAEQQRDVSLVLQGDKKTQLISNEETNLCSKAKSEMSKTPLSLSSMTSTPFPSGMFQINGEANITVHVHNK